MNNDLDINYALLSTQRALLGEVTQNLRAVVIDLQRKKKQGKIFFYYNGEISEEDFDIASCTMTEITAAFPVGYSFEEHIERLDAPNKIPILGRLAFLRKESNSNINQTINKSYFIKENLIKKMLNILSIKPRKKFNPIVYAKLSIQRALLGVVTPSLREVYVEIDENKKKLFISFFYDGEISNELFDLASTAIAEMDVPDYHNLEEHIERLDFPEKIPVRGHLVYMRKE